MISTVETLDKALKHSKDILTLAEENNWEQVGTELNRRDQQLQDAVNQPVVENDAHAIRNLIAEIQAVSAKIAALVESERDLASKEINKQHKGKKMQKAYNTAKRSY